MKKGEAGSGKVGVPVCFGRAVALTADGVVQ